MSFLFKYYPLAKHKSNTQKKLTLERVILATPSILSEKSETPFFQKFQKLNSPRLYKGEFQLWVNNKNTRRTSMKLFWCFYR